jgi:hypothetical protein
MSDWTSVFKECAIPSWLVDFDRDPSQAVDDALWDRYYFGSLNTVDAADLLIDWARGIGEENAFLSHRQNWQEHGCRSQTL